MSDHDKISSIGLAILLAVYVIVAAYEIGFHYGKQAVAVPEQPQVESVSVPEQTTPEVKPSRKSHAKPPTIEITPDDLDTSVVKLGDSFGRMFEAQANLSESKRISRECDDVSREQQIAKYCDQRKADLRKRLDDWVKASHAQQKGQEE